MKKIPTIFIRNPENMRELLDQQHPDCGWVFAGEGIATRKYDGTCVAIIAEEYLKRREVKPGKKKPADFVELMCDPNTDKCVGWVPVLFDSKEDQYHVEAFQNLVNQEHPADGTYELCGPKIQGNPEGYDDHVLIPHSNADVFPDCPRTMDELQVWLTKKNIEGIVFHHPDGRMAKIKKRDFHLKR